MPRQQPSDPARLITLTMSIAEAKEVAEALGDAAVTSEMLANVYERLRLRLKEKEASNANRPRR